MDSATSPLREVACRLAPACLPFPSAGIWPLHIWVARVLNTHESLLPRTQQAGSVEPACPRHWLSAADFHLLDPSQKWWSGQSVPKFMSRGNRHCRSPARNS